MRCFREAILAIAIVVGGWVGNVEAATVSGFITDASNGESLPYANVVLEGGAVPMGTLTNVDGYFAVQKIPAGRYRFVASYIGYRSYLDSLTLEADEVIRIDVELEPQALLGAEVLVKADAYEEEKLIQPGFIVMEAATLEEFPALFESDVLRSLHLMPGIQAASDISTGLYVRGGGPDQTLILLDQIPLYNPSHAFGFFSTFNSDAIKDMSLHKGAYPASYGGRLGAVLDVRNRDGNRKEFQGTGGISLIAARMTLEGPVGKGSWMISGRRTYLDPILAAIRNDSTEVPAYYFYDLNAKLNLDLGAHDKVSFSGYFGRDDLNFDLDETSFINVRWGNVAVTGKWTHVFRPGLYGNFMVAGSQYESDTSLSLFDTPILFENSIRDLTVKGDLDYFANPKHSISGGFLATWYRFRFNQVFNQDEQLDLKEKPTLLSFYLQDNWQAHSNTQIRLGVRSNMFSDGSRFHVEPRLAISQQLSDHWRVKTAGGLYHQYLQLVTTEGFSGGDFWVPLDETVEPGRSVQGVVGLEWEPSPRYMLSVESYLTGFKNLVALDTKVAVDSEETKSDDVFVTGGTGHATGVEVFLNRRTGALTGWIGYTLGWTRRTFDELNGGKEFPPKYDRRHDASVVLDYRVGKWSFGGSVLYATGQAYTPASARYSLRSPGSQQYLKDDFLLPSQKNSARLLPYHRMDLNVKRRFRLFGSRAEAYLQVFNAYNRRNEWFVQYNADDPETDPDVVKMLPVIPTFGINFSF
jgi:hypothetical protein